MPPTFIFDPLWGEPLVSMLHVVAKRGRIVQLGQASDANAQIPSSLIRGKDLDVLGFTNLNLSFDDLKADYLSLVEHVAGGFRSTSSVCLCPKGVQPGSVFGTGQDTSS
jgi:hypothetical protein